MFSHADGMNPDLALMEVLKEPYFSKKLLRLIGILSNFGLVFLLQIIQFAIPDLYNYSELICSWKENR